MSITNRGRKWEIVNSLWVIILFTLLLCFIAFFYIGIRAKQRKWLLFGCMYMALCFVVPMFGTLEGIRDTSFREISAIFCLISWIACIFHGFISRREYLTRRDLILANQDAETMAYRQEIQESVLETLGIPSQGYMRVSQLPAEQTVTTRQSRVIDVEGVLSQASLLTTPPTQTSLLKAPPPQAGTQVIPPPQVGTQVTPPPQTWAPPVPPSRAHTQVTLQPQVAATPPQQAGPQKIDLNHCTEQQLVSLPGVGVASAKRAVELRSQIGGFTSVEDFCKQLKLQPYFADQIQQLAITTPMTSPRQSGKSRGRVIDI